MFYGCLGVEGFLGLKAWEGHADLEFRGLGLFEFLGV